MIPELSIIIPAYNCSNTIVRCLDSIITLSWNNVSYEVLVIDDASTDDTRDVIANYQLSHLQVRLLCQPKNMRQGAARNRGIKSACGKFILFVDADDAIDNGVVSALQKAYQDNLDICFFTMLLECQNGNFTEIRWSKQIEHVVDGISFLNDAFDFYVNGPTRGVIRRDFLISNILFFKEGVRWEDGDYCIKMYKEAKQIAEVEGIGYVYYRNAGSTTQHVSRLTISEQLNLGIRLITLADTGFAKDTPIYNKIIEEACWRYFHQNLRLRNLTKLNWFDNIHIHKSLTKKEWQIVCQHALSRWDKIISCHYPLASFLLFFACPISKIGRESMALVRKLKSI